MKENRTLFIGVGGLGKTTAYIAMREEGMPFDDAVVVDKTFKEEIGCMIKWIDTTFKSPMHFRREIRQILCASSYDKCWIVGGLGGDVASEYLPLVADIAKEIGISYNILVTSPFLFEGKRRQERSKHIIAHLEQAHGKQLHLFDNEEEVPKDKSVKEIFDTFLASFKKKIAENI